MENVTLGFLNSLSEPVSHEEWKAGLDAFFLTLRKGFVFDNIAIYLSEGTAGSGDPVYARAVGRGRSAEADAAWGEGIANSVITSRKIIHRPPDKKAVANRVEMPYLLGIPLYITKGIGALVFVRFGGPEYTPDHIQMGLLAAGKVAHIFERRFLREALEQLESARHRAQLQDDFIATVSHDLHTPLGFIKGYTTSLLRSDTKWDPATQHEFLTIVDEEADHLVSLIDRMLDSARLQNGMLYMDLQPVRLETLLKDVTLRIKERIPTMDIHLDLESTPPIQADSVRLVQVFDNLFENAVKYAPGSPIDITLKIANNAQIIVFADHGPGIPVEHLPFIFERFYRVPGQPSSKRGTGLGLFICRELIHAHGGQISVETSPETGTAFRIELPVPLQAQVKE
jgi:signal transduction histidine kinase